MRIDVCQLCVEASRAEKLAKKEEGERVADTSHCSTAQAGTDLVNGIELEEAQAEHKSTGLDATASNEHDESFEERNLFAGNVEDPEDMPHFNKKTKFDEEFSD